MRARFGGRVGCPFLLFRAVLSTSPILSYSKGPKQGSIAATIKLTHYPAARSSADGRMGSPYSHPPDMRRGETEERRGGRASLLVLAKFD